MGAGLAVLMSASSGMAHGTKIPIGDGNVTSTPTRGAVMSCQQRFNPNAGGAHRSGDWIKGSYWYPDLKPVVDGNVIWGNASVTITKNGDKRRIIANGLPDHTTGHYPIQPSDDAYQYDRNPNRIGTQRVNIILDATPSVARQESCVPMGMIGVAINGVAIFNALDGPGRDAVAHEIQDACNGHPERSGQYHYHGPSECVVELGAIKNGHSGLVGYALDGFGIYGSNGTNGQHLSNADLDQCHGHVEKVVWDGKLTEMYHYHLTDEYPYTLGCFKGTPVKARGNQQDRPTASADQGNRQGLSLFGNRRQQGQQRQGSHGPEAILEQAAAELGIDVARLRRAVGPPPPNFREAAQSLGISEAKLRRAMDNARQAAGL